MIDTKAGKEMVTGYEIFIGILSIISIIDLVITSVVPLINPATKQVLIIINLFLGFFFFVDFIYRFFTAQSKRQYFLRNYGWADFISCWPGYGLRILRIFRLARVFQLIEDVGYKRIISSITDNRAEMAIYIVIVMVIVILQIGGNWVIIFESQNPDANIKTGGDALWWAFATITTVGYGDKYPTTTGGRLIGVALMTCGIAIIAVFTGFLSNSFITKRKKKDPEIIHEAIDPKDKIAEIKLMLEEHERASHKLKEKLDEIEKML